MKHEAWAREALEAGVDLTPAARAQLVSFEALLRDHALPFGMVAAGDADRLWDRHLLDAVRAVPAVPGGAGSLCDLGSGAGLPGIPLAICLPDLSVTLTETRRKRAAFLALAVDQLGLGNVAIHAAKAETIATRFDVCTARAFAGASAAWAVAEPLLRPGGVLLYWAGSRFRRSDVPGTVRATYFRTSALARSGPVVIMARQ